MPIQTAYNNAQTTLAGGISNTATVAALAAGTGALFSPAPTSGQYFVATLNDAATGLVYEIVHVTAVAGDVVTLVRGQEGTTAQNWLAGDFFANLVTAGTTLLFAQVLQHAGNPNGSVAGTAADGTHPPTCCWDPVNQIMWYCTQSGPAATAQWIGQLTLTPLATNAVYYVATSGSDSNPGTAGLPWATIQHAWDFLQNNVNLNGNTVTINVANGTYAGGLVADGSIVGSFGPASVIFVGNPSTPSNCTVSVASGSCFTGNFGSNFTVNGFAVTSASINGNQGLISAFGASYVNFEAVNFRTATGGGTHVWSQDGSYVRAIGNYSVSGPATVHWYASNGTINSNPATGITNVTISNTPAFTQWAYCTYLGTIKASGTTFSGTVATGSYYHVDFNSIIITASNQFPGNAAGTATFGGVYE